jgi:hypothetical protein
MTMSPELQAIAWTAALFIGTFAWLKHRWPNAGAEDNARQVRMFESAGVSGSVDWIDEKGEFVFKDAGRVYKLTDVSEGPWYVSSEGNLDGSTWACLETAVGFKGSFSLKRKGATERILGTAGLSKPTSSGDPRFDDHFTIESETPDLASKYFSDEERRRAAQQLFGLGYTGIGLNEGALSLYWIPFSNGSTGEDGPLLRGGLDAMKILAGASMGDNRV